MSPNAQKLPTPSWARQPGLLMRIFQDPAPVLDELTEKFGPVCGFGAGPARLAIVGDPAALREMFAMSSDHFRWGHKFNVLGFVVGAESMIVSDGEHHQRRRSAVQGAFSRRRLNGWIPMIVDRTDAAIDELLASSDEGPQQVDLYEFGRSLVLEVVVRALFGQRLAGRAEEIGSLFQRPQDYLEAPGFKQMPHPFPNTARSRVRDDRAAIDAIVDEQIAHLRSHPREDPLDVLATLVGEATLRDSEIRDQVVTLMGAGYDTTSASFAWMVWEVSLARGLWARLGEEADAVFGPAGQEASVGGACPDHQTLAALDLASRTMREATRLHPAGVISPREAAQDVVIGGYRIPKGTLILWSAYVAGRSPEVWTDPLRFDPDRFLAPTEEEAEVAKMAWVPFGRGARNCIGFALAQMELTLILSRVAQRLIIDTDCTTPPKPVGMVVNRPDGGAPMTIAARA